MSKITEIHANLQVDLPGLKLPVLGKIESRSVREEISRFAQGLGAEAVATPDPNEVTITFQDPTGVLSKMMQDGFIPTVTFYLQAGFPFKEEV